MVLNCTQLLIWYHSNILKETSMKHININIRKFKNMLVLWKTSQKTIVTDIAILLEMLRGEVLMFSLKLIFEW